MPTTAPRSAWSATSATACRASRNSPSPARGCHARAARGADQRNETAWPRRRIPVKPQKIIWDLRTALKLDDIVICDVGAHKMWMARMFRCEYPNTCIISNGFASMVLPCPAPSPPSWPTRIAPCGGDRRRRLHDELAGNRNRAAHQDSDRDPDLERLWLRLDRVKQMNYFKRASNVKFTNPDFVKYAESFGAKGYR